VVARRRFEFWLRSGDMQWNFFNHLAETNTLTTQANNVLYYLGVRPSKPILFDEVRHPLVSERFLSSVKAKSELKNQKLEFDSKYRERLLYLQKSAVTEGKEYVFCPTTVLPFFSCDVSVSHSLSFSLSLFLSRSIAACLRSLTPHTWHESNDHPPPSFNQSIINRHDNTTRITYCCYLTDCCRYFATGFEKITTNYKMKLAFRRYFGVRKKKGLDGKVIGDTGTKGVKAMQGKQALVEGLQVYVFCYTIVLPFFSCLWCLCLSLSYSSMAPCLHSLIPHDV
jgi:hypothetical protein